jgi:hypothetical protein
VNQARVNQADANGIEERLDLIARLLTLILTKDMTKKEAVLTLSRAGFAPKDLGAVLGMTSQQASVILYDAKQAATKQGKVAIPRARA